MAAYLAANFFLTTAGNFRTQTLLNAMLEVGSDRILFSIDYPFQEICRGTAWLENASISDADRNNVAGLNAAKLLNLPYIR